MQTATSRESPGAEERPARGSPLVVKLYELYAGRLYNYCRYHLGDRDMADEAVSRIFEKVLRNLHRYDPRRGEPGDWLFAIARNAVSDQRRSAGRRATVSLEAIPEHQAAGLTPEESALERERRQRLAAAVGRLPAREREIVALKFAGGLSNQAIAGLCRLSPGNVAVILCRAIRRARADLEREEASS